MHDIGKRKRKRRRRLGSHGLQPITTQHIRIHMTAPQTGNESNFVHFWATLSCLSAQLSVYFVPLKGKLTLNEMFLKPK